VFGEQVLAAKTDGEMIKAVKHKTLSAFTRQWFAFGYTVSLLLGCGDGASTTAQPVNQYSASAGQIAAMAGSTGRGGAGPLTSVGAGGASSAGSGGTSGSAAIAVVAGGPAETGGASGSAGSAGGSAGTAAESSAPMAGGSGALVPLTLWIAGDSTVMTYGADRAPLEGWGQELKQFLESTVTINNQAIGGRSTGNFMYKVTCPDGVNPVTDKSVTPDQWGRIKNGIKPGDFCLIQFGHNDESEQYCDRYVALPEFKENLSAMADAILARQATPIFVTPMSRLSYKNGEFQATLTDYSAAMKEAAQAKGVEVVDLNTMSVEFYKSVGYEKVSTEIFEQGGSTHFQKQGAIEMARLVSEGLAALSGGLAPYVKK
jgi:lysophospholipase L1-like esterase